MKTSEVVNCNSLGSRIAWLRLFMNILAVRCMTTPPDTYASMCQSTMTHKDNSKLMIRRCDEQDFDSIWAIINDGAQVYRGVIPEDRWTEPYMSREKLRHEIDD